MSWTFGYGSLLWRPVFRYERRLPGYITGWTRRSLPLVQPLPSGGGRFSLTLGTMIFTIRDLLPPLGVYQHW